MATDRKAYFREYAQKYRQSERGKAYIKEYKRKERLTETYKAYQKKYQRSEKYKAYLKKYRQQSDTWKLGQKKYRQTEKYKSRYKENRKKYRLTEKYKASQKRYRQRSEKYKATTKKYHQSEKFKAYQKKYRTGILVRLSLNMRRRVSLFLKSKVIRKTSKTFQYVGCTPKELKTYLENKFQPGMTWDNYGMNGWHIDHITALSRAKTEDELMKLFHFTNLQPLWAKENQKKYNKINI